jgi:hypothetical protein
MLYSVSCLAGAETKKPPSLAVCLDYVGLFLKYRVNLPLLHRQGAGMACMKIAGKEPMLTHEKSVLVLETLHK